MTSVPNPPSPPPHDITPVTIEDEMQRSYLDYAMSVIVSRALPDVRDGLKPVHRRIIYTMKEGGYEAGRPFRKAARIVGDVMGQYHPHGDTAIYDAMVRMAQDFSMRLPLVEGQGNFGSMDGDPPAAMRYTEARMARVAHALIEDIEKDTVEFEPNYDDTAEEPTVLPARFPNLLVNGAGGIAVGMATNIPPHNLGEVIDACCAFIDNPDITVDELVENHVPAPDFPTGGIIMGRAGVVNAFRTGRGPLMLRGRAAIEEVRKDRQAIVITEVPYQVNKARMVEIIAEHVHDKKIEGISDLRDESDRSGVRVVVEIKRDAVPDVVLAQLYRYTPLQISFGVNMLALDGGRPQMLDLKAIIAAFVAFREDVIRRRTIFELGKARDRGPRPGRPRGGGRQPGRGHRADPQGAGSGRRPRRAHGARLAGGRGGAPDRADRRAGARYRGRPLPAVGGPGQGHPGPPPAPADRARARQDRGRPEVPEL